MNLSFAIEQTKLELRRRHYSLKTEESYCDWIFRYGMFLREQKTGGAPADKMKAFLTSLALENVAASTQNQAFYALLFLYQQVFQLDVGKVDALRAKRPVYVRQAPTQEETLRLLEACEDTHGYPTRLLAYLLYECGMRVSEPLNLRRKDVDFKHARLTLYETKGGSSRVVRVPQRLVGPLRARLRVSRELWERNLAQAKPIPAKLPDAMARKNPSLGLAWSWWWVFPSQKSCLDPRTGTRVWWRCHEANVQRCVKAAAVKCGLEGWITPHVLRHAYATHLLEAGYSPRDVQLALGHKSLETTMGYCHGDSTRLFSPLEVLEKRRTLHILPPPNFQQAA